MIIIYKYGMIVRFNVIRANLDSSMLKHYKILFNYIVIVCINFYSFKRLKIELYLIYLLVLAKNSSVI